MPPIGKMRHRIQLQSRSATANDYGEMVPGSWSTYATVWAQVEPLGGGEGVQAGRTVQDRSYRITTWQRSDIESNHSVLLPNGRRLEIDSVANVLEEGVWAEIIATEVR